jgi:metal transporter CNNM
MTQIGPHHLTHSEFRIIPQAVSVRYGLAIGARCVPLVLAMMYIFCSSPSVFVPLLWLMDTPKLAPFAWPIAKLLDLILGANEATTYKKAELKSFLQFHRQGQEPLQDDEISILSGVLELGNKRAESMMTPMKANSEWGVSSLISFANTASVLGRRYGQRRRCA